MVYDYKLRSFLRQGRGIFIDAYGSRYEGFWHDNLLNTDVGRLVTNQGCCYEGSWKDDMWDG